MDRWGNYKENANYFEIYVTEDKTEADKWARAWLLKQIIIYTFFNILVLLRIVCIYITHSTKVMEFQLTFSW